VQGACPAVRAPSGHAACISLHMHVPRASCTACIVFMFMFTCIVRHASCTWVSHEGELGENGGRGRQRGARLASEVEHRMT